MTKQRRRPRDDGYPRRDAPPYPVQNGDNRDRPSGPPQPRPDPEPVVVAPPPLAPLTAPALQPVDIAPDAQGLGERFLTAFNDIEHAVREASGASHDSFAMLSRSYFTKRGLGMHLDALSDFVDLRNTLAHGRHFRSGLLATPAPEVVAQVEALRDLVLRPQRALELLSRDVSTAAPDAQLDAVLPLIADHGYSQIPVYDGDTYVGLLTNYAIARWLASAWDRDQGVSSAPVRDVLAYAAPTQQIRFLDEAATVSDVVAALVGTPSQTRAPAVLITHDGQPTSAPMGIATAGDLPKLVQALAL